MKFQKNVGETDKKARLIVGLVMAILTLLIVTGPLQIILAVLTAALLLTGATSYCGLYQILGINTCKIKEK